MIFEKEKKESQLSVNKMKFLFCLKKIEENEVKYITSQWLFYKHDDHVSLDSRHYDIVCVAFSMCLTHWHVICVWIPDDLEQERKHKMQLQAEMEATLQDLSNL